MRFDIEAVHTRFHPRFTPPRPGERECYRRILIVFRHPKSVQWPERDPDVPASNPSGDVDYGNIDRFEWDGPVFDVEGDFGHVVVEGDAPVVIDASRPGDT